MNVQQKTNKRGFTIIEVVLVLAIAALIFLMVFIALPALQRSQRDTARKQDVGTIASAVTSYTSNNRGAFPTASQLTPYVKDISSNTTTIKVGTAGESSQDVASGQAFVVQKVSCGATGAADPTTHTATQALNPGTASQFVVVTYLESGGGTSFCQDS